MSFRFFLGLLGALSVVLVGVVLLSPSLARADDAAPADNVSKARELFSEARQLVQAGNYAQACGKFEESLKLNDGIGTQFNLADCWEHVGRTASARSLFLGAAASAHALGQAEREQVAKARATALEPRLLRLVIDVRATDAELLIRRNQVPIERDSWSTATAVDPGAYLIEATAPGKKTWSARVTVPATATETVSVTVPPLEDAASLCEPKSAAPDALSERKPLTAQTPEAPPAHEPALRSTRRTAYALSLTGLGIASLGIGTVLSVEYQSKNDDAKAICPSSVGCSASDIDNHSGLVSDAKTFRTWSFVGFGVGGAALVGAAVLYFAPASSGERASSFTAAPFVAGNGTWGAVASGKF